MQQVQGKPKCLIFYSQTRLLSFNTMGHQRQPKLLVDLKTIIYLEGLQINIKNLVHAA